MILILSIEGDVSTDDVIDWLEYFGQPYYRLNDEDFISNHSVKFSIGDTGSIEFEITNLNTGFRITNKDVSKVWLRKFGFYKKTELYKRILKSYGVEFIDHLEREFYSTIKLLYLSLNSKKWLTHFSSVGPNKLAVLSIAKQCGLEIPHTICTNHKQHIEESFQKNEVLISKSIRDGSFIKYGREMLSMYVTNLSLTTKTPDNFFFSLIQNKVLKKFELRTFFIGRKFYTMAIYSQNDPQTKDDFRNYNFKNPNRWVPFSLPAELEKQIIKLAKRINLQTGSIDMIYTVDNKFIFLEVNPTGQFDMISKTCNYPIEREIAQYLIAL